MTAEVKNGRRIIPIGPYHPLQEEPELFRLEVDGETVVDLDVEVGWNHRGIEKLCETKTYDQIPFVVERICGICSTSHPIACVQAFEDAGDIEVPERALYIRSIIGELERIHSHLLWVGLAGHFLGYNTVWMWSWKYREPILDICETITGNRNHYAMLKVGGVRRDILPEHVDYILTRMPELVKFIDLVKGAVLDDPVLHARLKGIGVMSAQDMYDYGVLGPTSRASGVPGDVRRDDPYAAYGLVDWDVICVPEGDVFAKAVVRVLEMYESVKIIKNCLAKMAPGEIDSKPKMVKPGEGIGHHEAPRGETFHYCRSDGTNRPIRHKVRAPTYMNLPTFKASVIGESITDATIILAAIDPCYCCTERMAVYKHKGDPNEPIMTGSDLVRLSQEKTARLRKEFGL